MRTRWRCCGLTGSVSWTVVSGPGEFWQDLDLVFTNDVGWYMSTAAIRKKLARRGELLGVSGLTAGVLRHLHASVALQNGHNLVAVSKRLGHARISVASDIYAHVLPAWQGDVAEGVRRGDAGTEAGVLPINCR